MIRLPFDPDALDPPRRATWDAWAEKAEAAAGVAHKGRAAGAAVAGRKTVWRELKEWMFRHVFHGKCAYCETWVRGGSYGDAEHWRPKAAVTERIGDRQVAVVDERGTPHPGYFWLAYDWRNLVPACEECNTGTSESPGKGTQFPIKGVRVFSPDTAASVEELNDIEQPLLLHPFCEAPDAPERHIGFDEHGQPIAIGGSDRGAASIEVFNLQREWLNGRRKQLHDDMRREVKAAMAAQLGGGPKALDALDRLCEPRCEHAAAKRIYIQKWYVRVPQEEFGAAA